MVKPIRSRSRKINFKSRIAVRIGTADFGDEQAVDYNEAQQAGPNAAEKQEHVETGVDKEEESELHLQNAISAAQAALVSRSSAQSTRSNAAGGSGPVASSSKAAELPHIPTPDATGLVKEYESLYAQKCYQDPSTYIRFSDTVEDATGVGYDMDEDDEDWLASFNKDNSQQSLASARSSPSKKDKGKEPAATSGPLSESDFELIMDHFETVTEERLPTLHADPSKMPSFEDFEPTFADSPYAPQLELLRPLARAVYEYWKSRRVERGGKSIMPSLDHDESREDNPYVCFRRRDPKNVRKTRRTESQNLDRLVRLSTDLQAAYDLVSKVLDRERLKKDNLAADKAVFEGRVQTRDLKRKLGEKGGDEELLVTKKEKRRRPEELGQQALAGSTSHKLPIRIPPKQAEALPPGHTVPATPAIAEPAWLSQERATALLQRIEREVLRKRESDRDWEDFTDGAYQPQPLSKPAQFWQLPESLPVASGEVVSDRQQVQVFERNRTGATSGARPSFRRRVGRGGRVLFDRIPDQRRRSEAVEPSTRVLRSDRWKFDSDSNELSGAGTPTVIDDTSFAYKMGRIDLLQPGDLASLHHDPQHLVDAQKFINKPAEGPVSTQFIGKIMYKAAPPQPPMQPISQQQQQQQQQAQSHQQAGTVPSSAPGPMGSQYLPQGTNLTNSALMNQIAVNHAQQMAAMKRSAAAGGSPPMQNGASPLSNGSPMPQAPPGPRRIPSSGPGLPQQIMQQLPNGQQMMSQQQWQNNNGLVVNNGVSKIDAATFQNQLAQAQAQVQQQQNGMLATPRLPLQFPANGPNGTPRVGPSPYPMSPYTNGENGMGGSPVLSRTPSVTDRSPSQASKHSVPPSQPQPA